MLVSLLDASAFTLLVQFLPKPAQPACGPLPVVRIIRISQLGLEFLNPQFQINHCDGMDAAFVEVGISVETVRVGFLSVLFHDLIGASNPMSGAAPQF